MVIRLMLEWMYTADYTSATEDDMILNEQIEVHLGLVVAAEKYAMKGLRLLAVRGLKDAVAMMK
jgi:hypothetical protein